MHGVGSGPASGGMNGPKSGEETCFRTDTKSGKGIFKTDQQINK